MRFLDTYSSRQVIGSLLLARVLYILKGTARYLKLIGLSRDNLVKRDPLIQYPFFCGYDVSNFNVHRCENLDIHY